MVLRRIKKFAKIDSHINGQSIIEYALLMAIISAAFIVMQTYITQAVQGRLKQIEDEINEPVVIVL